MRYSQDIKFTELTIQVYYQNRKVFITHFCVHTTHLRTLSLCLFHCLKCDLTKMEYFSVTLFSL